MENIATYGAGDLEQKLLEILQRIECKIELKSLDVLSWCEQ